VDEDIQQLAEGIAHEEPAHTPGFADRTIFYRKLRFLHPGDCRIEIVDFNRSSNVM
jgi:hypothetical protein